MKLLLVWIFLLCTLEIEAQHPTYISIQSSDKIPWERLNIPDKRFIIAGEAHQVSSIYSFQLSQINYFITKGFRNLIWEVPYSISFIAQRFLDTGQDSLLHYLVHSQESLHYWKELRKLNQNLIEGKRIRIWGIDHELGENTGGLYRSRIFKKALSLLVEGKGELPLSLRSPFRALKSASTIDSVKQVKDYLKSIKQNYEVEKFFGDDYNHFLILVNRLDHYKVLRNDEMLEAFKEIYSLFKMGSSEKFLGRLGYGHIDKSYKNSFSYLLENDPTSPVHKSAYVVGVQYINCEAATKDGKVIDNRGNVDKAKEKKEIARLCSSNPSSILIFTMPVGEGSKGWTKEVDLLFVFSRFQAVTPLRLKFPE